MTPVDVLQKIERELRAAESAPRFGSFGFAVWMVRHLGADEFNVLRSLEAEVGEAEANRRTVLAMIASGKYRDAGGGEVERAT